jgi:hypothetical protein
MRRRRNVRFAGCSAAIPALEFAAIVGDLTRIARCATAQMAASEVAAVSNSPAMHATLAAATAVALILPAGVQRLFPLVRTSARHPHHRCLDNKRHSAPEAGQVTVRPGHFPGRASGLAAGRYMTFRVGRV